MKKFADTFKGDVIKIDGVCYEFAGYEEAPSPDVVGDVDVFADCLDCQETGSSSPSELGSSPSELGSSPSELGYVPSLVCPDPGAPVTVVGPSMVLRVTGSSGSITWCGKTWNLPADSGQPKEVCPTAYSQGGLALYYSASYYFFSHNWQHNDELRLQRKAHAYAPSIFSWDIYNRVRLLSGNENNRRKWRPNNAYFAGSLTEVTTANGCVWSPPSAYPPSPCPFTPLLAAPKPSFGDYLITNDFFSSVTTGGITYTWDTGTNWP